MNQFLACLFFFLTLFSFTTLINAQEAHFGEVFPNQMKIERVTSKGSNRQPIFVSNTSFIFVGTNKKAHKDPQLYFHDLNKGKEKRITHQRGVLNNGFYNKGSGQLLYSSTTDEEKETPLVLKKYLRRFPASVKNDSFFQLDFQPQEIYMSNLDGSNVERLTDFAGFDGFPTYLASKDRLYFSRWAKGQLSFFAKSLKKNLAPWKLTKTSGHDLGLKISPNKNQLVWYRFSPDFKSAQLLISDLNFKNSEYLTLESGLSWSPTWHPNGKSVIYSARGAHQKDFNLYEVAVTGGCKRQITSIRGDEFFPTLSPDGKLLLFTGTRDGREQIFKMPYPQPLECPSKTQ